MKKLFFVLIISLLMICGLHAQQAELNEVNMRIENLQYASAKSASAKLNWLSAEFYGLWDIYYNDYPFIGVGAHYELMFTRNLSAGASCYYGFFILGEEEKHFGIDVFARLYPSGKTFYLGLGLGFGSSGYEYWEESNYGGGDLRKGKAVGFAVTPQIGWKIDVGEPGHWFIEPNISVRLLLGYEHILIKWYLGVGYAY